MILLSAGAAWSQPLPDRQPPASKPDAQKLDNLKAAWEWDGRPRVSVLVVANTNGQPVQSGVAKQLQGVLVEYLGGSFGQIVSPALAADQNQRDLRVFTGNSSAEQSKLLAELVGDMSVMDVMVQAVMTPVVGKRELDVHVSVLDLRDGQVITEVPLLPVADNEDLFRLRQYGAYVANKIAERWSLRDKITTLRLVGLRNEQADDLVAALLGIPGVTNVDNEFKMLEGVSLAEYRITGGPRQAAVLRTLVRNTVKTELKMNLGGRSLAPRRMVGFVYKDFIPNWWKLTNKEDAGFDGLRKERQQRMNVTFPASVNGLRVAVMIGEALNQEAAAVQDPELVGGGITKSFDDQTLEGELGSWLRATGFDTKDVRAMKEKVEKALAGAQRFENAPHLLDAMKEFDQFDVLLYATKAKAKGDAAAYNVRLINRADASTLGFVRWPDSKAYLTEEHQVEPQNPTSVARYIVGNLVEQFDLRLQQKRMLVEVIVKNADDLVKVNAIAKLFEAIPASVRQVTNYRMSLPVGGFDVILEGDREELIKTVSQGLPRLPWPAVVDVYGSNQVVINLARKVTPDRIEKRTVKETEVEKTKLEASPPAKSIKEHLKVARASVCVVGVELVSDLKLPNGRVLKAGFFPGGTAWTVAPQRLATNAHVVIGLLSESEELKKLGGDIRFTARRGEDLAVKLTLGNMAIHPGFIGIQKHLFEPAGLKMVASFDVGVIDVADGDAGKPLALASDAELNKLEVGHVIGYAGFPMEGTRGQDQAPVMRQDTGEICALTSEYMVKAPPANNRLLHYDLITLGGSSGSPLFNEQGLVIGLNSAGDYLFQPKLLLMPVLDKNGNIVMEDAPAPAGANPAQPVPKVPKFQAVPMPSRIPVGFKYGQRVDMLRELLDGTAGQLQAKREQEWAQLAVKAKAGQVIP